MVKVYTSAFTYVPFLYFFTTAALYGNLYHIVEEAQPFIILTFTLINTFVHTHFKRNFLIKNIIHFHMWKTCTTAVYGILLDNAHDILFRKFNSDEMSLHITASFFYIILVWFFIYYLKNDDYALFLHIIMFYVPIRHEWEINLYLYVIFISTSTLILYSRCTRSSLYKSSLHRTPVIRFYLYIRCTDYIILVGFLQLLLEYITLQWDDINSIYAVSEMVREQAKEIEQENNEDISLTASTKAENDAQDEIV